MLIKLLIGESVKGHEEESQTLSQESLVFLTSSMMKAN